MSNNNLTEDRIFVYDPADGIKLLIDQQENAKGVALGFWFPNGSAHEEDYERGLSHFTEHMLFKGAGERDASEFSRVIDSLGGFVNAFTERETTCFHCLVPANHVELATSMLLDMVFKPKLAKTDFDKEKNIIINEILSAEDDIEDCAQDEFLAMVYKGHPAARKIAGRIEDIKSADYKGLLDFHNKKFRQGTLIITIAGNVNPDSLCDMISAYLNKIGKRSHLVFSNTNRPVYRLDRKMIKATGSQVYFFSASDISKKLSQDEYWKLSIANSAFGESMSSRLFMHIREDEGLCYNIGSSFYLSPYIALWTVSSSTTQLQFSAFAHAYQKEVDKFYNGGLNDEEVSEAVSRIQGTFLLASDDTEFRMKRLARQYIYDGSWDTVYSAYTKISSAKDTDDINKLITNLFNPEKSSILLYGKLGTKTIKCATELFKAEQGAASDE